MIFCFLCGCENEQYICAKCYSNIHTGLIEELEEMKFEILQKNIKKIKKRLGRLSKNQKL